MKRFSSLAALGLAFALAACGTTTGGGGTYIPPAGDTTQGTDTTTGGGGDNTKNKASVQTTSDSGQQGQVQAEQPAKKEDAEKADNKLGAINADKILQLHVTDGQTLLIAYVDTGKHPLPATGIPIGEPNGDAWVTYTAQGQIFNSKDKGTLDITTCPKDAGVAVVAKLNGVVVYNAAGDTAPLPGVPFTKSVTLSGDLNLVYFGGAGALECKPEPQPQQDAGSTDAGGGNLGDFGKPAGSTCAFNPCNGGADMTRQCCKYIPCLNPCMFKCGTDASSCVQACSPDDFSCALQCQSKIGSCFQACFSSCGVDQGCMDKFGAIGQCEEQNGEFCSAAGSEEAQDACLFDKCCDQFKAAF